MSNAKLMVKFNNAKQVEQFVSVNCKSSCNIDVGANVKLIDGCSIVGMFALDLRNEIPITIYGSGISIEALVDEYQKIGLDMYFSSLLKPIKIYC